MSATDLSVREEVDAIRESVTPQDVRRATLICFVAWTFAVYDFILFANLLPVVAEDLGWTDAEATGVNTWVTLGTAVVAYLVGPYVDRVGRRAGVITCVVGAALASFLTWGGGYAAGAFGVAGIVLLVLIRSLAGVGYSEQTVNSTYLSELYAHVYSDPAGRRRHGFVYSLVQSGWPIGSVVAAASVYVLEPIGGWELCFIVAVFPAIVILPLARSLEESPVFLAKKRLRELIAAGRDADADEFARLTGQSAADTSGGFLRLFRGEALRPIAIISLAFLMNWLAVLAFAFQGTLILTSGKNVPFTGALEVLIVSNLAGFLGYLFHGWLGDRFNRRDTIAFGWAVSAASFAVMVLGPDGNLPLLVGAYAVGTFFLIGPYAALLFFNSESFATSYRASAGTLINALGLLGAIIGGALFTATLSAADPSPGEQASAWIFSGFWWGCVPLLLSALFILLAPRAGRIETSMVAASEDVDARP